MRAWQEDLDNLFAFEGPPPAGEAEPREAQRSVSRTRRRRRLRKQSRRALSARRANLRQARAAPREIIYRPTEKRQAASRANLQKAQAARRTPRGNARGRLNALKHGLYATAHPGWSVRRLHESPGEFAAHRRRLERLFVPEDEEEARIVRRLADACWRRLRFFRAAAAWEAGRFRQILAPAAPRRPRLDVLETEDRAQALVLALSHSYDIMERESQKLNSHIEAHLRQLLRKRSEGVIQFRVFSPRRDPGSRKEARLNADEDGLLPLDDGTGSAEGEFKKLVREFRSLPLEAQVELLSRLPEDEEPND
jgi:hypothetical protein